MPALPSVTGTKSRSSRVAVSYRRRLTPQRLPTGANLPESRDAARTRYPAPTVRAPVTCRPPSGQVGREACPAEPARSGRARGTKEQLVRRKLSVATAGAAAALVAAAAWPASAGAAVTSGAGTGAGPAGGYKHLVVIYEENHSFDNLYGGWGKVHGQAVDGLADATAAQKAQVAQDG